MKGFFLALAFGVTLLGCRAATVTKAGVQSSPRETTCDFVIYTAVPEGYAEVGTVDMNPGIFGARSFHNLGEFKEHIRPAVCDAGGDAAVAVTNGHGVYIKATVLKKISPESSGAARSSASGASAATTSGVSPTAEATKPAGRKKFPRDALGFEFGSTPEHAQELCTSLEHEWRTDEASFGCTGAAVNVGAPVATTLKYCGGRLCELRAFVTLTKDTVGQREFVKLKTALITQYGEPAKNDIKFPSDCHDRLMACIVEGKATWEARWEWPSGSSIRAKTGTDGTSPVIGIRYHKHVPSSDSAAPATQPGRGNSLDAEAF